MITEAKSLTLATMDTNPVMTIKHIAINQVLTNNQTASVRICQTYNVTISTKTNGVSGPKTTKNGTFGTDVAANR